MESGRAEIKSADAVDQPRARCRGRRLRCNGRNSKHESFIFHAKGPLSAESPPVKRNEETALNGWLQQGTTLYAYTGTKETSIFFTLCSFYLRFQGKEEAAEHTDLCRLEELKKLSL
jgi:hypothetical protein